MTSKLESGWVLGPNFAGTLKPNSNLLHHRVKQFVFNEMVSRPTEKWLGSDWIQCYAKALEMCGTKSLDPTERATRDFYDFAIPEGWIVEA